MDTDDTVHLIVPVRRGHGDGPRRSPLPTTWTLDRVAHPALPAALRASRAEHVVIGPPGAALPWRTAAAALAPLDRDGADVVLGVPEPATRPGIATRLRHWAFGDAGVDGLVVAARTDAVRALADAAPGRGGHLAAELALLAPAAGLRVARAAVAAPEPVRRGPRERTVVLALAGACYRLVTGRVGGPGPADPLPALSMLRFLLFGVVGALSGVLYVLVYLAVRGFAPSAVANFVALAAAALFNIEANRAWTFRDTTVGRLGMHVRSGLLFAAHYVLTTAPVVALNVLDPGAGPVTELVVLLVADLVMTALRFLGLERWIFRARGAAAPTEQPERRVVPDAA